MNTKIHIFLILLWFVSACDQAPELRRYQEIVRTPEASKVIDPHAGLQMPVDRSMQTDDPNIQRMLADSVADVALSWTVPDQWSETRGSGMRLVTFNSLGADPIQCTVVSLSGNSGGLQANVVRWIRQLGAEPLNPQQFKSFLEKQSKFRSQGELNIQLIDLDEFASSEKSMMAAVIETEDKTIFIKMTGSRDAVRANTKEFKELCQSLKIGRE